MGGGSSEVTPHRRRNLFEALAERLPGVAVSYEVGCRIDRGLPSMDMALMTAGDEAGSFTMEYFDSTDLSGDPVHVEPARLSRIMWLGQPHEGLTIGSYSIRLTRHLHPRSLRPVAPRTRERRALGAASRRRGRRRQLRPD